MNQTQSIAVEPATAQDLSWLCQHDAHADKSTLACKVTGREVLVARQADSTVGWLRFGMFWDTIPFMNLLHVLEPYQGKGIGRHLVACWESQMQQLGYKRAMTSTMSSESAQHFYRKLGYCDCGCLLLPSETLEILFQKPLG